MDCSNWEILLLTVNHLHLSPCLCTITYVVIVMVWWCDGVQVLGDVTGDEFELFMDMLSKLQSLSTGEECEN